MATKHLDKINSPQDLKRLSRSELVELAAECRQRIIETTSATGGHLAPSLGAVELTIALHRCLDSPRDRLIWDVGHQCYTHKLITGRRDEFHTVRQPGGLSGFPRRDESPHDAFGTGHGSTSISAALGFAEARDLRGGDEKIVAVIGDGALTGGLALEALNQAGTRRTNLVVVLNDNEMSISRNVGGMSAYLARIRAGIVEPAIRQARRDVSRMLERLPLGDAMLEAMDRFRDGLKQLVVPGMLFEEFGFTYLGPIDGHDMNQLLAVFEQAFKLSGPVLVHVHTKKGPGYPPAEEDPSRFHGTRPFNIEDGECAPREGPATYSDVFGETLSELAEQDDRIVAISAAMIDGTGLSCFRQRFPDRCLDVGMAEEHAVTFAAGLAAAGMRPVVAIYSSFLQRSYDQILHDVALQKLPVVFCMDRAGIVGDDGPTHHGAFDIAYMRHAPGIVEMVPADELRTARHAVHRAARTGRAPLPARLWRGLRAQLPSCCAGMAASVLRDRQRRRILALGRRCQRHWRRRVAGGAGHRGDCCQHGFVSRRPELVHRAGRGRALATVDEMLSDRRVRRGGVRVPADACTPRRFGGWVFPTASCPTVRPTTCVASAGLMREVLSGRVSKSAGKALGWMPRLVTRKHDRIVMPMSAQIRPMVLCLVLPVVLIAPALAQDDAQIVLERVDALYRDGAYDQARSELDALLESMPENAVALRWRGTVALALGELPDAIRYLTASLAADPNSAVSRNNLGTAQLRSNRADLAAAEFEKAVELEPGGFEGHYNLATALSRLGQNDRAFSEYEKALAIRPQDFGALVGYGRALELAGDTRRAIVQYELARTVAADNLPLLLTLGTLYANLGNHAKAIEIYTGIIKLDPRNVPAHLQLGAAYYMDGKYQQAAEWFSVAAGLAPDSFVAYYNLGQTLAQLGRDEEAIASYEKALNVDPSSAAAYEQIGLLRMNGQDWAGAAGAFSAAQRLDPDNKDVQVNLARCHAAAGDETAALTQWEQVVARFPDDASAHRALAALYLKLELYDEALREYLYALELAPDDGHAHNNVGLIYLRRNNLSAAGVHFTAAIRAQPDNLYAINNLGVTLERKGQRDLAREQYEKALAADPDFEPARKNLDRLSMGPAVGG